MASATRGAERAHFDQQPLDARAMIAACVEAYALTRDARAGTGMHAAALTGCTIGTI
jgi:hypothetical protein